MAKIFLVAETKVDRGELLKYLEEVGAGSWKTDASGGPELLTEVGGRLCYRSFAPGLNENVTKVREGNALYLKNILDSHHGSVLEHASATFIFHGVSRVFTHELVRHRAGCAGSQEAPRVVGPGGFGVGGGRGGGWGVAQESLRFVRLEDFEMVVPELRSDWCDGMSVEEVKGVDEHIGYSIQTLRLICRKFVALFDMDSLPFSMKKEITSWIRRFVPMGVSTSIMWTCNMRALRHVIAMRTSVHAEEEIREVFQGVAEIAKVSGPNLFQDMRKTEEGDYAFENEKV